MKPLRVIFLSEPGNPHSSILLEHLLNTPGIEIDSVITSSRVMNTKNPIKGMHRIFKKSGLRYLLMRIREALYMKHYSLFKSIGFDKFKRNPIQKIRDIITKYKLKEHPTDNINGEDTLAYIREHNPDIMVSCIFNQILKKEVIGIPKYGCINVHRSKLPEHRGLSATFLVLADNDDHTGVTIHEISPLIDAGNILGQKIVPITKEDTVFSLSQKMMHAIKEELVHVLEVIPTGEIKGIPIDPSSRYYSHPTKQDVKNFLKQGRTLL